MRISDWSSDVCSSDLSADTIPAVTVPPRPKGLPIATTQSPTRVFVESPNRTNGRSFASIFSSARSESGRSEEHTSELQSLMRISYAVFCLKKKKKSTTNQQRNINTHTIH